MRDTAEQFVGDGPTIASCNCLPGYLPRRSPRGGFVCLKVADMKTTLPCY